jgi:hypothetical protein
MATKRLEALSVDSAIVTPPMTYRRRDEAEHPAKDLSKVADARYVLLTTSRDRSHCWNSDEDGGDIVMPLAGDAERAGVVGGGVYVSPADT